MKNQNNKIKLKLIYKVIYKKMNKIKMSKNQKLRRLNFMKKNKKKRYNK